MYLCVQVLIVYSANCSLEFAVQNHFVLEKNKTKKKLPTFYGQPSPRLEGNLMKWDRLKKEIRPKGKIYGQCQVEPRNNNGLLTLQSEIKSALNPS